MTLDRASGDELLTEARRALLESVLPALPAHLRYQGLMIANAMAIGVREWAEGDGAVAAVLLELAGLYPDAPMAASAESPAAALSSLEQRLARDIRAGVFDGLGLARERLRQALRAMTIARLRLSNPKILTDRERGKKR
jgi:hypothetical protein